MKKLISKIKAFLKNLFGKNKTKPTDQINSSTTTTITTTIVPQPFQPIQETIIEEFKYVSFGSPNCSKAVEDPKVQIKNLKWSKSGLSFKWKSKTKLEQWGIDDPHKADALACFGYLDKKGTWRFGKIDWISSDRISRDMHNVDDGYNGIKADEYYAAKQHGFFIMDQKGKKRSNIIIA